MSKVKSKAEGVWFSTVTGTYPDHIFESIKAGDEALPVFDPVWLSRYRDSRGFERLLKRVFDLVLPRSVWLCFRRSWSVP